jgi:SAM-dependent methyltransferase
MAEDFYTDLAPLYDRMIPWAKRLANEGPSLRRILDERGARTVLDAACGTGAHVEWLARHGYAAQGADASAAMLAVARARLAAIPESARPALHCADWAALPDVVADRFDAVFCLGNSLPYAADAPALDAALAGLWSRVAPGGRLVAQFKNFGGRLARNDRFLPLQQRVDPADGSEYLFIRQYDWREGTVDFTIIYLARPAGGEWTQRSITSRLGTWTAADARGRLEALGARVGVYGSLAAAPFDPLQSEDVVLVADRENE